MNAKEEFQKNGYVIFREFFSSDEISMLESYIDPIYQQWRSANNTEIFNRKLVNMHSLTRAEYFKDEPQRRLEFFKLIASQKLRQTLAKTFSQDIYFHNTQLFFNPSNPQRLPYWHRDLQYSHIDEVVQRQEQNNMLSLHVRIPLIDECSLEVVSGSHKRWDSELERNVRFELNGHKNSEPLANSQLIELARADIVIFSAQMLHRGIYELNPQRKAFDLCAGKYHPLISQFLDPLVLPTRQEFELLEDNSWYKLARKVAAGKAN